MKQYLTPAHLAELGNEQRERLFAWGREKGLDDSAIAIGHLFWFLDEHITDNTGRYWEVDHWDDGRWYILARSGLYQDFPDKGVSELIDALWECTKIVLRIEAELKEEGLSGK